MRPAGVCSPACPAVPAAPHVLNAHLTACRCCPPPLPQGSDGGRGVQGGLPQPHVLPQRVHAGGCRRAGVRAHARSRPGWAVPLPAFGSKPDATCAHCTLPHTPYCLLGRSALSPSSSRQTQPASEACPAHRPPPHRICRITGTLNPCIYPLGSVSFSISCLLLSYTVARVSCKHSRIQAELHASQQDSPAPPRPPALGLQLATVQSVCARKEVCCLYNALSRERSTLHGGRQGWPGRRRRCVSQPCVRPSMRWQLQLALRRQRLEEACHVLRPHLHAL